MIGVIIQSTFLVITILVVQKLLGDKLHAYMRYGIWLLVALRLLIPVNFIESPLSVLRVANAILQTDTVGRRGSLSVKGFKEQTDVQDTQKPPLKNVLQSVDVGLSMENNIPDQDIDNADGQTEKDNVGQADNTLRTGSVGQRVDSTVQGADTARIQNIVMEAYQSGKINRILYGIWVIGSLLVGGFLGFSHFHFRRRLRRMRVVCREEPVSLRKRTHVPVYRVKGLETPCLVGLVRPAIYISMDIDTTSDYFRYAIMHEEVHYLHKDHIWAFARAVLVSVYWFHPFVWIAAAISAKDGEIACDHGTVRRIGQEERFAYSEMLLAFSKIESGKRVYSYGTMLHPDKSELKERILRLTETGRNRVWAGILAMLLMVIAVGCAFTGASETDGNQKNLLVNEAGKNSTDVAVDDNGNTVTDSGNTQDKNGESNGNENLSDNEDADMIEPQQVEARPAEISGETPFGVDGPRLDYAGGMGTNKGSRIILHDYFGLIVYDLSQREIVRSLDLVSIGCDKTQGDDTCQVAVSEDGSTVWLHPMSRRYMYRYEVEENLLYQEPLVKTFELDLEGKELFNRYSTSEEESTYWHSNYLYEEYKDEKGLHRTYIYLYAFNVQDASDSGLVLRNLGCGWDDMEFKLFEDSAEVQDVTNVFPYNYHGDVVDIEITYDKPCNYTRISDAFGGRAHPITGEVRVHDGIDFAAAEGTDITAAADGVVYETGYSAEYGNYVVLLHINGEMTYYCHCQTVTVKRDDQVKRGEKIATVGSTGRSTGSHLHFALSRSGWFVNPEDNMEVVLDLE